MINEMPPKMTKENAQMWQQTNKMNRYTETTRVEPVLRFNPPAPKQKTYLGEIS